MPAFRTALASTSVAAVSLVSLALAGCSSAASGSGGGSAAGGNSAAASPAAASSTKAAAAAAQGKLDGVPAACPPAGEVMSNLHLSDLTLDGGDPSFCRYLFKGSKTAPYVAITFNSAPGFTPVAFHASLKQGQHNVRPVPGLADAAYTFGGKAGGSGLSILSNSTVCSILSTVPTSTAGKVALARLILAG